MSHANTDVIIPTDIYSEEYRQMVNTLPRAPRLEISESVKVRFRDWNTSKNCVSHTMCQINAHSSPLVNALILNDVFTPNMRTVWSLTEPYVSKRSTDAQIIQARETHKSLKKIMVYIKEKLAKILFADELRARRQQERERVRRAREAEEIEIREAIALANRLGANPNNIHIHRGNEIIHYVIHNSRVVSRRVSYRIPPPFVCNIENTLCNITEEEAEKEMEDDCMICACKHKTIEFCSLQCGHQYGMDCLTLWMNTQKNSHRHPTCPYCRIRIKKIVKNAIAPIDLSPIAL